MESEEIARAERLRDAIMSHWNPPATRRETTIENAAPTAVMIALAWVFGREFVGPVMVNQQAAIDSGLRLLKKALGDA